MRHSDRPRLGELLSCHRMGSHVRGTDCLTTMCCPRVIYERLTYILKGPCISLLIFLIFWISSTCATIVFTVIALTLNPNGLWCRVSARKVTWKWRKVYEKTFRLSLWIKDCLPDWPNVPWIPKAQEKHSQRIRLHKQSSTVKARLMRRCDRFGLVLEVSETGPV